MWYQVSISLNSMQKPPVPLPRGNLPIKRPHLSTDALDDAGSETMIPANQVQANSEISLSTNLASSHKKYLFVISDSLVALHSSNEYVVVKSDSSSPADGQDSNQISSADYVLCELNQDQLELLTTDTENLSESTAEFMDKVANISVYCRFIYMGITSTTDDEKQPTGEPKIDEMTVSLDKFFKIESVNVENSDSEKDTVEQVTSVISLINQPLHEACKRGQADLVRVLMKLKFSRNKLDSTRQTGLHWAARFGWWQCVWELLYADAELEETTEDSSGKNPDLHVSESSNNLLNKGSPIVLDAENCLGDTCFHLAAWGGHWKVLKVLLEFCGMDLKESHFASEETDSKNAKFWKSFRTVISKKSAKKSKKTSSTASFVPSAPSEWVERANYIFQQSSSVGDILTNRKNRSGKTVSELCKTVECGALVQQAVFVSSSTSFKSHPEKDLPQLSSSPLNKVKEFESSPNSFSSSFIMMLSSDEDDAQDSEEDLTTN